MNHTGLNEMTGNSWDSARQTAANRNVRQREYWTRQFSEDWRKSSFPPSANGGPGGEILEVLSLADPLRGRLLQLSQNNDILLHIVLTAALAVLMERATGRSCVTLAVPVYQSESKTECVNSILPLKIEYNDSLSFKEFLVLVRQTLLEADENRDYPLDLMPGFPQFDVSILLTTIHSKRPLSPIVHSVQFQWAKTEDNLRLDARFDGSRYDPPAARTFLDYYRLVLEQGTADLDIPLADIDIVSPQERERLLEMCNSDKVEVPVDLTVVDMIRAAAGRDLQAPALCGYLHKEDSENPAQPSTLTYEELLVQASELALKIKERGAGANSIVGLLANRTVPVLTGMLAIMMAGCSYLPLDGEFPPQRLEFMLKDSAAPLLLAGPGAQIPPGFNGEVLMMDLEPETKTSILDLQTPVSPDSGDTAYVIYTSGSTGTPKGVVIEHRQLVNYLLGLRQVVDFSQCFRYAAVSTISADLGNTVIYRALTSGGCLHMIGDATVMDGRRMADYIQTHSVDCLKITPPHLAALQESGQEPFAPRRVLILGGEASDPAWLERVRTRHPHLRIYNHYGPSEATIGVTVFPLPQEGRVPSAIPIGRPFANAEVYVLDRRGKLVPGGLPGQLCIGGPGLGRGYLNRPQLTAERFMRDGTNGFGRLYATGDRARFLQDGTIDFMGRVDRQVKIRGFRAEPGEVAAALKKIPGVQDAAVTVIEEKTGDHSLAAYPVLTEWASPQIDGLERYSLPNGLRVAHVNKNETDYIFREIFELQAYGKYGVTFGGEGCILDVGGNIGLFSLFVKAICPDAEIHAFEPNPYVRKRLAANLRCYVPGATVHACGLSAAPGEAEFTFFEGFSLLSGLYADAAVEKEVVRNYMINQEEAGLEGMDQLVAQADQVLDHRFSTKTFPVRLDTLSQVMRRENIQSVHLLKINVEKAELDVLRGVESDDWQKIRQVVVEVDVQENLDAIVNILEANGFQCLVDQDVLLEGTSLCYVYAIRRSGDHALDPAANQTFRSTPPFEDCVLTTDRIRRELQTMLPSYLMPSYIVPQERLPLNPNGKLDPKALPDPLGLASTGEQEYTAPRTAEEILLQQVWQEVLGRGPIGIHDNYFMNGGDSIKSIQVASRLNREGFRIEMKDIFKNPTIARLAPLLKKNLRVADQSPVTGRVLLTPVQRDFFLRQCPGSHHFNQSVMLHSPRPLDRHAVQAVFSKLLEHHDALRMVFPSEQGSIVQENLRIGDVPLVIDEQDLASYPNPDVELAQCADALQASFDLAAGPLLKVGLYHLADGDRLLIVIHHLVTDGVSWRVLFEDIAQLFSQFSEGTPLTLPPKSDSFQTWATALDEYSRGQELLRELPYWLNIKKKADKAVVLPRDEVGGPNRVRDIASQTFTLSEEETNLLLTSAHNAFGTETQDLLIAALAMGLNRRWGAQRILLTLEGHGREEIARDIDLSRTVGWFTSTYPLLVDIEKNQEMAAHITQVKERLRAVPNRGIGYGVLTYMTPESVVNEDLEVHSSMIFNYLGQFDTDVSKLPFALASESAGCERSPDGERSFDWNVSVMVAGGRLEFSLIYSLMQYQEETIRVVLEDIHMALRELVDYCVSHKERRFSPSDFTYTGLSQEQVDRLSSQYQLKDIYRLSPTQQGMLYHALYDDDSTLYQGQISFRLRGALEPELVKRSFQALFQRYDVLRTVYVHQGLSQPLQVVLERQDADFSYLDISAFGGESERIQEAERLKRLDRGQAYDLSRDSLMRLLLMRLGPDEFYFTWNHHHIVMDGWCAGILITDFFELYNSFRDRRPPRLPEPKPYRVYIQWLEGRDRERSRLFWNRYLELYGRPVGMPKKDCAKDPAAGYLVDKVMCPLESEESRQLEQLASCGGVTLNIVIQALWALMLAAYSGKRDVVFGAVVSGRPADIEGIETMVGLFINAIPVRVRFDEQTTFARLVNEMQQLALQSEPHHHYPLAEIQKEHPLKQSLLDHVMGFENYPLSSQLDRASDHGEGDDIGRQLELLDLDVLVESSYDLSVVVHTRETVSIQFEFNANVYDAAMFRQVAGNIRQLVRFILENNQCLVDDCLAQVDLGLENKLRGEKVLLAEEVILEDDGDFDF